MNGKHVIYTMIIAGLIGWFLAAAGTPAYAVDCDRPESGNYTVSTACSFPKTDYDGLDGGSGTSNTSVLTVGTGGSLSVLSGQTLSVGSMVVTAANAAVTIISPGQIKLGSPIWMTDADGDGYPAAATYIIQSTTPTDGVRRTSMTAPTTTDCNDGSAYVYRSHAQCYKDSDGDAYTDGLAANSTCINTTSCNTATYASASTLGAAATAYTAGRILDAANSNDCNDTNAAAWRNRYQDNDADTYGKALATCVGNDAGYVDNGIDCNDGSNLVFTAHAQCYADMDNDSYTAGLQANSTCLNTSSCATATKASASTDGAAVTTYTASQMENAANGSDCNDGSASLISTQTCYIDSDGDGYTNGTGSVCAGASCTNVSGYRASTSGSDCNDGNANLITTQTCYIDSDGDGYTNGTGSICAGASCTNVGGYRASTSGSDCYDGNANANPGQTSYFTSHRGDGSFDYNCNGTEYYYNYGAGACSNNQGGGGTGTCQATQNTLVVGWTGAAPACGASASYYNGSVCTSCYSPNCCSTTGVTQSCR